MKKTFALATLFAAAMTVGAAAQYGTPQGSSSKDKDKDARDVTVTGCLQSGDMGGTTGTTGSTTAASKSSSSAGQYFLTNASFGASSSSSATTTTPPSTTPPTSANPTAGTTGSPASDQNKIRLVGFDKDKLSTLVNHQVEIKGRWEKDSSSSSTTGAATTTTPPAGAEPSAASSMLRTFHVSDIKDIASTCTPAER